jgi:putative glycosyltransferase (exosortase G-associated)
MVIIKRILNSFIFWGAWILIPVIMEIVPSFGSLFLLLRRRLRQNKPLESPKLYPEISIIVPVYNSADTLFNCIKSINDSTYPNEKINVFLVNNQGKDDSFSVFAQCQERFPTLRQQWMNAKQGKSRALNLALYNSEGKYIINIDSDGVLEPHALVNLITKFENRPKLNCMTGAILTTPEMIQEYHSPWSRLLRNLEFMEYAQAFLAGRSYASEINSVYTLSGAFSAFRKSAILKSRLYNTDTICEDTQLTFQMRQIYKERVEVCEDALFLVDPIESVDKLYTQRQRWQRGSLEVAKMFMNDGFKLRSMFTNINVKTLLYDHTFAFPRMIWYLALICLLVMKYSGAVLVYSTLMIFALYIVIGYAYFFTARYFLKANKELRAYYTKHWYCIILMPAFNLMVFFIRLAGIINSVGTDSAWKTQTLSDEKRAFAEVVAGEFAKPAKKLEKSYEWINAESYEDKEEKKTLPILWYVITGILISISALLIAAVSWTSKTYGVSFAEIKNTLTGNIQVTASEVVIAVIKGIVLPVILVLAAFVIYTIIDRRYSRKIEQESKTGKLSKAIHALINTLAIALPVLAVLFLNLKYDLIDYYQLQQEQSQLYEEYYVSPDSVSIEADGKTKNLIYIYLESMETTYADTANGGAQTVNYIPNLTELVKDNISFSNTTSLGGFHTLSGFGYTISSIFSTTSGLPYKVTIGDDDTECYNGVITLGDILNSKGYNQEFLCGSDASFAGRNTYFTTHGDYEIFDLYTAREKGYIADDYYVWWGFEDSILFDIAKDEAIRLAKEDEPFNLTMLTVDTHHIAGYICDECDDKYDVATANVVACTDRLVSEFISWCSKQDFYKDTTIVLVGDHPRMDTYLVDGTSYYDRTEYNCFINASNSDGASLTNREFTNLDLFPTVISSLGFNIEGNRLGLGTNLFSDEETIAEQKGIEWLETQANKSSDYYMTTFVE